MMDSETRGELVLLGRVIFSLIITLLILSYTAVGLRLWVRYRITRSPGWDDAAMVATLVLFSAYCAFILAIACRTRNAAHKPYNEDNVRLSLIFVQLSEVFYILTTTLLKISLGLFFLRVLTKKWQKLIFHIALTISTTYGFLYVFVALFQCGDPTRLADNLLHPSSPNCLPSAFLMCTGYVYGIINVIADWTFVLLPVSVLMDSDLDRRSKISVSIVMCLGAVGSVSSVLRMVYLSGLQLQSVGLASVTSRKVTIWATAEPGTGIVAASVAILRPLVRKMAADVREKAKLHSRKGSHQSDDTIRLTRRASFTPPFKKKPGMYSLHSEDDENPWSPTLMAEERGIGGDGVPKMIVVKGMMSPAMGPKAMPDDIV
ncbi:hypothetical protein CFE70_004259 [Pyrenophora teres f. teres 0-1]|nr:hypothetical protein HRS9139_05025 [Pyrenophora teres f. teres]KAE8841024.1 hypothetical protein PTNB85_04423 [Pyrenophora teres f. teres]KAE8848838.1 hypothetical protein HRS9122_02854 [Pyrenophora teres f. teres]KAE8864521.1 hypothetical protein PTNB29_04485 [Pyrenophora teres f. teres]KAE8867310.1 hypothetical protein PTNB73_05404 [Pyrenophora teres f. teres]